MLPIFASCFPCFPIHGKREALQPILRFLHCDKRRSLLSPASGSALTQGSGGNKAAGFYHGKGRGKRLGLGEAEGGVVEREAQGEN